MKNKNIVLINILIFFNGGLLVAGGPAVSEEPPISKELAAPVKKPTWGGAMRSFFESMKPEYPIPDRRQPDQPESMSIFPEIPSVLKMESVQKKVGNLIANVIKEGAQTVSKEGLTGIAEGALSGVENIQVTADQKKLLQKGLKSIFAETFDEQFLKDSEGGIQKAIDFVVDNINKGGERTSDIFKEGGGFHTMAKTFAQEAKLGMEEVGEFAQKGVERGTNVAVRNMAKIGLATIALATLFWGAKYGIPLAMRRYEEWLKKPSLIIDSSQKASYFNRLKNFFGLAEKPVEMVFNPILQQRLDNISKVTKRINERIKQGKKNIKYRNLMLWGPPGTGKTMFAKKLAKQSGLQWALMSGSSFAKFKDGEGIEELDKLFRWANNNKGLMIIIDEAEGFLRDRTKMDPNSPAYQLLTNFLNYTGERSNKFMIVFMTNHKDIIDSAMFRRIDDLIELPLPTKDERVEVLKLYKKKLLMDVAQNGVDFVKAADKYFNDVKIEKIAGKTDGFSYGELEGVINVLKTDADVSKSGLIDDELIDAAVDQGIEKHKQFHKMFGIQ